MKLFVEPEKSVFHDTDTGYYENYLREVKEMYPEYKAAEVEKSKKGTYAAYNYTGGGITGRIKTGHFETALRISKAFFGKAKVLDMGCADGYFIPSLSKYFPEVVCADINLRHIEIAGNLIKRMNLQNVKAVCTEGNNLTPFIEQHRGQFDIIFLLEVMEHVGERSDIYPSKLRFLKEVAVSLKKDGLIVISVPVMTGIRFFIQRCGLAALGMDREPMTWKELIDSGVLCRTEDLEKRWWPHGHAGFNHNKLLRVLLKDFVLVRRKKLVFQEVFVLRKK